MERDRRRTVRISAGSFCKQLFEIERYDGGFLFHALAGGFKFTVVDSYVCALSSVRASDAEVILTGVAENSCIIHEADPVRRLDLIGFFESTVAKGAKPPTRPTLQRNAI